MTANLRDLFSRAKERGIMTWQAKLPTTAITHPKMFEYFKAIREHFYFVPAVDPTRLIIFNTEDVHENIMYPLIKCILVRSCILPIGNCFISSSWCSGRIFFFMNNPLLLLFKQELRIRVVNSINVLNIGTPDAIRTMPRRWVSFWVNISIILAKRTRWSTTVPRSGRSRWKTPNTKYQFWRRIIRRNRIRDEKCVGKNI